MNTNYTLKPASILAFHRPFHYFVASTNLCENTITQLLEWLEEYAEWKLIQKEFYEQYELHCAENEIPEALRSVHDLVTQRATHLQLEEIFETKFEPIVSWSLHKLTSGQRIQIHNDLLMNGETHRLIINLNRGWHIHQGGFLILFNSDDATDIHRVLMPLNGSAVGFAISEVSNHAVSEVLYGERFSIIYSLYSTP